MIKYVYMIKKFYNEYSMGNFYFKYYVLRLGGHRSGIISDNLIIYIHQFDKIIKIFKNHVLIIIKYNYY